jgi:hypothetical protein
MKLPSLTFVQHLPSNGRYGLGIMVVSLLYKSHTLASCDSDVTFVQHSKGVARKCRTKCALKYWTLDHFGKRRDEGTWVRDYAVWNWQPSPACRKRHGGRGDRDQGRGIWFLAHVLIPPVISPAACTRTCSIASSSF